MHPVGKIMRWIEKWMPYLSMASTSSIAMQSLGGGDRTTRAGCRCENMVFVCFLPANFRYQIYSQANNQVRSAGATSCTDSGQTWHDRCFQNGLCFQMHYTVLIFVARRRHNFREIAVKNCEKSKNRWKTLCAPLCIDSWEIWRKFHCSSLGPRMWMCTYIIFFPYNVI